MSALRAELLHADRRWTPELELLYIATARADLVARIIGPALRPPPGLVPAGAR